MSRMLKSPRRNLVAAVVNMDGFPVHWATSEEKARQWGERREAKFARYQRKFGGNAYLPHSVIALDDDGTRVIERLGQFSTYWRGI